MMSTNFTFLTAVLSYAVAAQHQEPVRDHTRQARALSWNLEEALYRQGHLSRDDDRDFATSRDMYGYDEHLPHGDAHFVQRHDAFVREADDRELAAADYYHHYHYRNNEVFRYAKCFDNTDCEYLAGYTCEVIDSYNHVSECLHHSHHSMANFQGHPYRHQQEDGQGRNAERGHFELGYWCLKDTDCESKHCAQVGPRMYDKECQGADYEDFKLPEKKKRTHHRRDVDADVEHPATAAEDDHPVEQTTTEEPAAAVNAEEGKQEANGGWWPGKICLNKTQPCSSSFSKCCDKLECQHDPMGYYEKVCLPPPSTEEETSDANAALAHGERQNSRFNFDEYMLQ